MNPIHRSLEKSLKALQVTRQTKLLLGVSGGIDSMVMLHALYQMKFSITIAHINFKLRVEESDGDAELVKNFCFDHQLPFLYLEMDTKKYAAENHLNTQLAARKIRYDWWDQLHVEKQFDAVATAHNLDDQIETFFINVLRGTGIKGLQGITSQRNYFIRPMLDISRAEIEAYAHEFNVDYRTDSSNLGDDYQRNRIRHHLIPLLHELSPGFPSRMKHNLNRIQKEWTSWEVAYQEWAEQSVVTQHDSFSINFIIDRKSFLLRWLEEKGIPWNLSNDFIEGQDNPSGRTLQYNNHRLSRTTSGYFFEKIKEAEQLIIEQPGTYVVDHMIFSIYAVEPGQLEMTDNPNEEYISANVVTFPLKLRPIEAGDIFQPLGMHGKQKKIQDLLVDRKLDMHEKSRLRLLTNDQHIIWIAGIQLDERAKVTPSDKRIYIVKMEYA